MVINYMTHKQTSTPQTSKHLYGHYIHMVNITFDVEEQAITRFSQSLMKFDPDRVAVCFPCFELNLPY